MIPVKFFTRTEQKLLQARLLPVVPRKGERVVFSANDATWVVHEVLYIVPYNEPFEVWVTLR